jgi:hypothetical protein
MPVGFNSSAEALSWGYAATSYSLMRPPRIFVRAIRRAGIDRGWAVGEIGRELHLGRNTVKRFVQASRVDDLPAHVAGQRPSVLDP